MSATYWETRWQQFLAWPRAIQILLGFLVAVAVFIVVHDDVWELSRSWNDKAAQIEKQVTDAGNYKLRELQANALDPVVVALGPVALPERQAPSSEALNQAVDEIIAKYRSVSDYRFDAKGAATMPTVLQRVMPAGTKIDRISGEVRFDAKVDDAIAIVADLESRPEIEAVTTVRMTKVPAIKKVRVNLTVDAWVISDGKKRVGAGNA